MRCRTLALILLAIIPSLGRGTEPASPPPVSKSQPLVQEVTGRGLSERLVHLKAALAHLERAGFEDAEVAKAAGIIGDLIDAEKQAAGPPRIVEVKLQAVEANRLQLQKAGVDWKQLTQTDDNAALAAMVEDLIERKLVDVISHPQIRTANGREATVEVEEGERKFKVQILPTVLQGDRIGIRAECNFARTIRPKGTNISSAAKPQTISRGATSTLEVPFGKSVVLGGLLSEGPTEDTFFVFLMTPHLVTAHDAKVLATRPQSEPKIKR